MKTNENLSLKNSEKSKNDTKIIQLNVAPSKSLRPQKSMMRVKSVKPSRNVAGSKIKIKRF